MKKRSKASKQRLNNLLILLLLTATLLVMSTYAWFTANRTVNIDSIDVKVSTSSGLQISADGIDWKTVLTKADLSDAYNTYPAAANQLPESMAPVSTALNVVGNRLAMFYGSVEADMQTGSPTYGEYVLKSIKTASGLTAESAALNGISGDYTQEFDSHLITTKGEYDKGYYIAFDVFVKSGNAATAFYMSGNVNEVEPTGNKDAQGNDIYQTVTNEKGIANAARVALIKGGNTGSSDTVGNIQALPTNGTVLMWEPNSDYHTTHGIDNGISLGWISGATHQANTANQPVINYDGITSAFSDAVLLKNATAATDPTKFKSVTPTWTTKKAETKPSLTMPATDGTALASGITKYRIYMWVEGQDIDCENFASGTYLQYNLSFSLDPYSATP